MPEESKHPTTESEAVALHRPCSPPVFRWEQCYELGGTVHWALRDTATDEECMREGGPSRVSCGYMVLAADYDLCMDGRTINEQFLPALITRLLNEHYACEANDEMTSHPQKP